MQVTVCRTAARGNPVSTLIARYFGMTTADIGATATAEASPANAMDLREAVHDSRQVDREADAAVGSRTTPTTRSDNKGQSARESRHLHSGVQRGRHANRTTRAINVQRDTRRRRHAAHDPRGHGQQHHAQLLLLAVDDRQHGGYDYRWNIANCNQTHYHWGDRWSQEPGNMVGPTTQGIDELIAQDPAPTGTPRPTRLRAARSATTARASSRSRSTTRSTTTRANGTAATPT